MDNKKLKYGDKVFVINRTGFTKEVKLISEAKFIAFAMREGSYFVVVDNGNRTTLEDIYDVYEDKNYAYSYAIDCLNAEKKYHDNMIALCNEKINKYNEELKE